MAKVKHLRTAATNQNDIHNELRAYPTPSSDENTYPTTCTTSSLHNASNAERDVV